jgi:hypothetical protein
MNVVRPGIDGALALLGQVGFVAVQDGGSNEGKAIVGGAAGRHTTVGGGGARHGRKIVAGFMVSGCPVNKITTKPPLSKNVDQQ